MTGTPAAAPAAPRRRRGLFYGWYMIAGMMGIHWYVSASFVYGFGVLFVPILETFGWSRSIGSLTALFMQPVGGAVGAAHRRLRRPPRRAGRPQSAAWS